MCARKHIHCNVKYGNTAMVTNKIARQSTYFKVVQIVGYACVGLTLLLVCQLVCWRQIAYGLPGRKQREQIRWKKLRHVSLALCLQNDDSFWRVCDSYAYILFSCNSCVVVLVFFALCTYFLLYIVLFSSTKSRIFLMLKKCVFLLLSYASVSLHFCSIYNRRI